MVVFHIQAIHFVVGFNQFPGNPRLIADDEQVFQLACLAQPLQLPVEHAQGVREELLIEFDADFGDFIFQPIGLVGVQIRAGPGGECAETLDQPVEKSVRPGQIIEHDRPDSAAIPRRQLLRMDMKMEGAAIGVADDPQFDVRGRQWRPLRDADPV